MRCRARATNPSQHCRCEGVRRVRHHAERSSWRDEVLQIALHYSGVAVDHFLPKPRARPACSSTAMTRAPASRSGIVRAPVPAPRSTTSSPRRIAAPATICSTQYGSSRCQPQGRRPDTTHHADHRHDPKVSGPARPPRRNFPCAQDAATGRERSIRTLKLSAYSSSPAWRMVDHRSNTVCNAMRPSSRAKGAPRQ